MNCKNYKKLLYFKTSFSHISKYNNVFAKLKKKRLKIDLKYFFKTF